MGPTLIRAGVFDAAGYMLGKAKRSTKLERGRTTVLQRVARCVGDAVDECDLRLEAISGAGVGIAPAVATGWEAQGATPAALQQELAGQLPLPVFVESCDRLAALGIYATELAAATGLIVAFFCGPELRGHLLVQGNFPADDAVQPLRAILRAAQEHLLAALPERALCQWSKAELRKAARRRDPRVRAYAKVLAEDVGIAASQACQAYPADRIVLAGGVIDELREELLPIVLEAARRSGQELSTKLMISELADNAVLVGGAYCAQRATNPSV